MSRPRIHWFAAALLVCARVGLAQQPTESFNGKTVIASQVIVKLSSPTPASLASLQTLLNADTVSQIGGSTGPYLFHSRSWGAAQLLNTVANQPNLQYAEPNYVLHTTAVPNDPNFNQLWGLHNTSTPGADISAESAWNVSTGSAQIVVGVVDTGVDYTHPDLAANIWSAPAPFTVNLSFGSLSCPAGSHGYNAITHSCDPMDDNEHGTHVSGTIGAVGNNGLGVVGVNWTTTIMALKFLNSSGSGSTSDAVDAIEFAIQVKNIFASTGTPVNIRVLSNSWGGTGFTQSLLDEINKANTNGMLFVAAAGNASTDNDTTAFYPANYAAPNVVAVAATDINDALASFSNYGPATVSLGAPGVNILSTLPGASYGYLSGTSMATPHVSGSAALVLSHCNLTTTALKADLLANVDSIPSLAGKTITGGRLDVNKAINNCNLSPATSIWSNSAIPATTQTDSSAIEMGLKFRSDVAGSVTGVRFYKASNNTGTHIGNLWTSTGTLLASVTFSNETASGWQQATFSKPVAINPNTTYIVSYFAPNGGFSYNVSYFATSGFDDPPLHALAAGVDGPNGLYIYGSDSFPNLSYSSTNYWVDILFSSAPPAPLAVSCPSSSAQAGQNYSSAMAGSGGVTPYTYSTVGSLPAGLTLNASTGAITGIPNTSGLVNFTAKAVDSASTTATAACSITVAPAAPLTVACPSNTAQVGQAYSSSMIAGGGVVPYTYSTVGSLPGGLNLNTSTGAITGSPTSSGTVNFTAKVVDVTTTSATTACSIAVSAAPSVASIWSNSATPSTTQTDPSAIEMGLKFRSDVAGSVTGVRFYKASNNTGVHIGNLWTSTGTLLASVTFSNETASGWQQATFSKAVAINPSTTYIVSYYAPNGGFSYNLSYFATSGFDNPPLHALAAGVDGPNGLYLYGSNSFPNLSYSSTNYWVDIIFSSAPPPPLAVSCPSSSAQAGQNYSSAMVGSGGVTPYTYSTVGSLPGGLTLNASTGAITGIPNASGLVNFTAKAVDSASTTATAACSITVAPAAPLTVACPSNTAQVGQAYSSSMNAGGGVVPYTYSTVGSLPGGLNLNTSTGAITGSPTSSGTVNFTAKVVDVTTTSATTACSIAVSAAPSVASIWSNSATPSTTQTDPSAIEMGLKFRSDVSGSVTGVRFYKASNNTGAHIGNLWTSTGTLLASVTFSNETASGWQQATFSKAVAINPSTTYIVSYYAPNGGFSYNLSYFATSGFDNPPLHALAAGVDGPNGLYLYGSNSFPNLSYSSTNYWVDIVFAGGPPPPPPPLAVSCPTSSAQVGQSYSSALVGSGGTSPYTFSTVGSLPAGLTLNTSSGAITGSPTTSGTVNFTGKVVDSTTTAATNACTINVTSGPPPTITSIWTTPVTPTYMTTDPSPIEMGLKFRSDVAGSVTGVRFYKAANTGSSHIGNLWTSTGTLLASVAFTNETASGWQQATFSSPVLISANTTYIVSYFSPNGGFAYNLSYFLSAGFDNPPLHALANGFDGPNGLYEYGPDAFPNLTYSATNYWVDVVFSH